MSTSEDIGTFQALVKAIIRILILTPSAEGVELGARACEVRSWPQHMYTRDTNSYFHLRKRL